MFIYFLVFTSRISNKEIKKKNYYRKAGFVEARGVRNWSELKAKSLKNGHGKGREKVKSGKYLKTQIGM